MNKYREAIIAIILFCGVLLFLVFGLLWWVSPMHFPSAGLWYCEELNTTLDTLNSPRTMTRNEDGMQQTYPIVIAYSGVIYYTPGDGSEAYLLTHPMKKFGSICKELFYSENRFIIELYETEQRYTFVRIG